MHSTANYSTNKPLWDSVSVCRMPTCIAPCFVCLAIVGISIKEVAAPHANYSANMAVLPITMAMQVTARCRFSYAGPIEFKKWIQVQLCNVYQHLLIRPMKPNNFASMKLDSIRFVLVQQYMEQSRIIIVKGKKNINDKIWVFFFGWLYTHSSSCFWKYNYHSFACKWRTQKAPKPHSIPQ